VNIILISPGLDKRFNDNYGIYKYLSENGFNILIITQKQNPNKSANQISPEFELDGYISIYRLFESFKKQKSFFLSRRKLRQIKKIVKSFSADIILCEELSNLYLAYRIKRYLRIPLILRVEFAYNINFPYRTMGNFLSIFKNKIIGDSIAKIVGSSIWHIANKLSDKIISCYYEDQDRLSERFFYIPWPSQPIIQTLEVPIKRGRAVFIGAFDDHKNLIEFKTTLPILLNNTPLNEFYFIGDGKNSFIVDELVSKYPNNIFHIKSLSRESCLEYIMSSFFCYSPATRGGWGFIGDTWATKTPLVVSSNHYDFKDRVDSIVVNIDEIAIRVNELYNDSSLYNVLSSGGYSRYLQYHSIESIGKAYSRVISS